MSEVIYKNEFGEYKVGDKVFAVTSGYGNNVNIFKGVILGITKSKCLLVKGFHTTKYFKEKETGAPYSYDKHGWAKERLQDGGFISHTGFTMVAHYNPYEEKHTLQLNRVMPRAE